MLTVVAWTRQDGWLGGDPATGDLVPLPNVLPMRTLPTRVHEDDFTAALLAVTARGSLENIRAALLALPGVTAAHVQPAGPADIRAYVDGGSDEEIMMCLYRELPIYVVSLGSVRGRIENDGACCEVAFSRGAPPYAVGDEVEWRPGPLDHGWTAGRVISVIDDRPDDGIDKPFWIVRVDTAGERQFCGPANAVCLRRRPNDTPQTIMERRIGRKLDAPLPCARCGVVYAPEALDGALHCSGCATAMRGRPAR